MSYPVTRALPLRHRILFFVPPPPLLAHRIASSTRHERRAHALMGKPLPPERLHVTAIHLGDYPDYPAGPIARAMRAAETVTFGPFEMAFDRVGSFAAGEKRPLVLTCGDGLADFQAFRSRLRMALRTVGLADRLRPKITPHMTLLYDRHAVPEHSINPIRWTARDFVLVDSLVGMTQHVELGRWALGEGLGTTTSGDVSGTRPSAASLHLAPLFDTEKAPPITSTVEYAYD